MSINRWFFSFISAKCSHAFTLNQYNMYRINTHFLWNTSFSHNGWQSSVSLTTVRVFCFSLFEPMHHHELLDYRPERSFLKQFSVNASVFLVLSVGQTLRTFWGHVGTGSPNEPWTVQESCPNAFLKKVSSWCKLVSTQSISNLSQFNYHFPLSFLLQILVHEPELFSLKYSCSFPKDIHTKTLLFKIPMVSSHVTEVQKVFMLSISEQKYF